MKFVVTGTTGQVGWELIRALQPLGEVVPVSVDELDLTDAEATRALAGAGSAPVPLQK